MPDTASWVKTYQDTLALGQNKVAQRILDFLAGTKPEPTPDELLALKVANPVPPGGSSGPGPVDVQPGLDWALTQEKIALEKYIAELTSNAQRDIAQSNSANVARLQEIDASLQRELQAGRITAEQAMQSKELKQRESEFARDLALRTVSEQNGNEINKARVRLDEIRVGIEQSAEARQERTLQAQLAANPANFVLYEFYKRGGQPGVAGGPQVAAGATQGANLQPAYSDQTLQSIAASIGAQGAGRIPPLYNPNLGGTGAFGATVPSPNDMSRAGFESLDPTERAILDSFIRGGVETQAGVPESRVAINPEDWYSQLNKSFVPTVDTGPVRYG